MRTKNAHPVFARVYARLRPMMDRQGAAEHRARLLAGTAERVGEVGVGEAGVGEPHMIGSAVREVAA